MSARISPSSSSSSSRPSRTARVSIVPPNTFCCSLDVSTSPTSSYSSSEKTADRRITSAFLTSPKEEVWSPTSPALVHASELPERAQRYLSLLAESTCSQGSMQKHLLKLACRGAAGAAKMAEFIQNPMESAVENVMESASEMLLKQLSSLQAAQPSGGKRAGWKLLRHAVLGVSCFKSAAGSTGSQDDSCLPLPRQQLHPAQSKLLSLLLSVLVSASASAVADAMPMLPQSPFSQVVPDVIVSLSVGLPSSSSDAKALPQVTSFKEAPSVRSSPSPLEGIRDSGSLATATGGMAVSTAVKLVASDSKRFLAPGLGGILSSALEAAGDCIAVGETTRPTTRCRVDGEEAVQKLRSIKLVSS